MCWSAATGGGYLLGDSLYDTNPLHTLARTHGLQMVAPRKKPGLALGHREQDPGRLRSIELLEGPGRFGRELYAQRVLIDQQFAQAGNLGCGLRPLPNWVRRPAAWRCGSWANSFCSPAGIAENKDLERRSNTLLPQREGGKSLPCAKNK